MSLISMYKCDGCGISAEGLTPTSNSTRSPLARVPAGWFILQAPRNGIGGQSMHQHLCNECVGKLKVAV